MAARSSTISSMSAWDTLSGISAYACAKRAADRFVQAAAVEYRAKRLRINAIIPSTNDTNMLRKGIEEYGQDFDAFAKSFIGPYATWTSDHATGYCGDGLHDDAGRIFRDRSDLAL